MIYLILPIAKDSYLMNNFPIQNERYLQYIIETIIKVYKM